MSAVLIKCVHRDINEMKAAARSFRFTSVAVYDAPLRSMSTHEVDDWWRRYFSRLFNAA